MMALRLNVAVTGVVLLVGAWVGAITPWAGAEPSGACGPDQATAVQSALSQLSPEPLTGRGWGSTPLYSNYDPCADLSAIVVMIQGGTGSSPEQALMFHRGSYLGTGTSKAYAFTTLDSAASTNDTVVLRYKDGRNVCTACPGPITTVRYQWQGDHVAMLDPAPPW
jgi:LppP/LprE lipoprotein